MNGVNGIRDRGSGIRDQERWILIPDPRSQIPDPFVTSVPTGDVPSRPPDMGWINSQRPTSNSQGDRPPGTLVRLKQDTTVDTRRSDRRSGHFSGSRTRRQYGSRMRGRHGHAAPENPWECPGPLGSVFAERVFLRARPCRPLRWQSAIVGAALCTSVVCRTRSASTARSPIPDPEFCGAAWPWRPRILDPRWP
jgi:hypothetical protein